MYLVFLISAFFCSWSLYSIYTSANNGLNDYILLYTFLFFSLLSLYFIFYPKIKVNGQRIEIQYFPFISPKVFESNYEVQFLDFGINEFFRIIKNGKKTYIYKNFLNKQEYIKMMNMAKLF